MPGKPSDRLAEALEAHERLWRAGTNGYGQCSCGWPGARYTLMDEFRAHRLGAILAALADAASTPEALADEVRRVVRSSRDSYRDAGEPEVARGIEIGAALAGRVVEGAASTPNVYAAAAARGLALAHNDWPTLANVIREVDGNHDLGAGELAERILSHPKVADAASIPEATLDVAWTEAEAALPEDGRLHLQRRDEPRETVLPNGERWVARQGRADGTYEAWATNPIKALGFALANTPIEALRKLTAALAAQRPSGEARTDGPSDPNDWPEHVGASRP